MLDKISPFLIAACLVCNHAMAQVPVEAELEYKRLADNTITVTATILDTEEYDPVPNLQVEYITRIDSTTRILGQTITNDEGVAVLSEVPFSNLLLSLEHKFYISYRVIGTQDYVESPKEITFQEVDLRLNFEEIDSVKQIVVGISSWNESGDIQPIEEVDAYLYVPRLFSLLPIGDIYTEEGGTGMRKFPTDLPGGKNGEMTVVVKIEDHEKFGNVEISNSSNWGKPAVGELNGLPRALWTARPPLWMIITFIILMTGVWFHYGWIILNISKIKSDTSDAGEINYEL